MKKLIFCFACLPPAFTKQKDWLKQKKEAALFGHSFFS